MLQRQRLESEALERGRLGQRCALRCALDLHLFHNFLNDLWRRDIDNLLHSSFQEERRMDEQQDHRETFNRK